MIKHSRQREAILDNLRNRYDHPTADTVYGDIRGSLPNISLGTVYRNLSLLSDLGEIQKIITGVGPDRFDGNAAPHCHFRCNNCGQVLDIEFAHQDKLTDHVAQNFDGLIEGNSIQFYGLCPDCNITNNE